MYILTHATVDVARSSGYTDVRAENMVRDAEIGQSIAVDADIVSTCPATRDETAFTSHCISFLSFLIHV